MSNHSTTERLRLSTEANVASPTDPILHVGHRLRGLLIFLPAVRGEGLAEEVHRSLPVAHVLDVTNVLSLVVEGVLRSVILPDHVRIVANLPRPRRRVGRRRARSHHLVQPAKGLSIELNVRVSGLSLSQSFEGG